MKLTDKKCVPCEGGTPPFSKEQIQEYMVQLGGGRSGSEEPSGSKRWEAIDGVKIKKQYKFFDFKEAMKFVNKVAELAEKEQHHPTIRIAYNKVGIELTTHAIQGLSENDFVMAAKIENLIGKQ